MTGRLAAALIALGATLTAGTAAADGGPCRRIREACEAAGHRPAGDCMREALLGRAPKGMGISAAEVAACKARKDKRGSQKTRSEPAAAGSER